MLTGATPLLARGKSAAAGVGVMKTGCGVAAVLGSEAELEGVGDADWIGATEAEAVGEVDGDADGSAAAALCASGRAAKAAIRKRTAPAVPKVSKPLTSDARETTSLAH